VQGEPVFGQNTVPPYVRHPALRPDPAVGEVPSLVDRASGCLLLTCGGGSSSGSLRGSGVIGDWQRTSRPPSTPHALSSTRHPSCSRASDRSCFMTFETDSESDQKACERGAGRAGAGVRGALCTDPAVYGKIPANMTEPGLIKSGLSSAAVIVWKMTCLPTRLDLSQS
jgi:hypothetical protein